MNPYVAAAHGAALSCVLACAVTEVRRKAIYNAVTYPAAAAGLALALAGGGLPALQSHALALGLGLGIPFLFFLAGSIGGGDVKLLGAVGALGGYPFIVYATAYSFGLGAAMALGVLVARGGLAGGLLRALRLLVSAFVPLPATEADREAGRMPIPFGVAVALGVLWRLVEEWAGGSLLGI
jgi:prepilin peptidase CpaA